MILPFVGFLVTRRVSSNPEILLPRDWCARERSGEQEMCDPRYRSGRIRWAEVLRVVERPEPGRVEVLVRMRAAG
ncbi:hypothetical protein [Nocardia sp. NBC_00403]|uniref:hypothetical protein n=1 Tax=Nocardia sp. NBC_00403 TaxID=2975990 RepID=UPI002E1D42E0